MKNILSKKASKTLVYLSVCTFFPFLLNAQEKEKSASSAKALADKLANPVASMISVPFQSNLDYGIGPDKGTKYVVNFQPVIPIKLSNKVNLITRYIIPIIDQRNVLGPNTHEFGLSDATITGFFAPSDSKGFIWGAGPVMLVPIATKSTLGTQKFGIGPSVLALKQGKALTFGLLANQIWSVAGNADREAVNQLFIQPFFNHSFSSGATLGGGFELTQNWEAKNTALIFTPTIGAVTKLGKQAVQMVIGPRIPLAGPDGQRPDFGLRAIISFVFPN